MGHANLHIPMDYCNQEVYGKCKHCLGNIRSIQYPHAWAMLTFTFRWITAIKKSFKAPVYIYIYIMD